MIDSSGNIPVVGCPDELISPAASCPVDAEKSSRAASRNRPLVASNDKLAVARFDAAVRVLSSANSAVGVPGIWPEPRTVVVAEVSATVGKALWLTKASQTMVAPGGRRTVDVAENRTVSPACTTGVVKPVVGGLHS